MYILFCSVANAFNSVLVFMKHTMMDALLFNFIFSLIEHWVVYICLMIVVLIVF